MSNQVAVKKSQVQVAIVKSEELKSKIAEIEASHKQLQLDLDNAERESGLGKPCQGVACKVCRVGTK